MALLLESRVHGRHLLDIAHKSGQGGLDLVTAEIGPPPGAGNLAFGVVRVGGSPEHDSGSIAFLAGHQVLGYPCGLPKADEQHSRGHGVQRASVAYLALAGHAAHRVHDVMRGHARRLVDIQDTRQGHISFRRYPTLPGRAMGLWTVLTVSHGHPA